MRFPTKDVVSRARLRFDVALMLLYRCWNWVSWQEKRQSRAGITGYVRSLSWDSSPQFGKDFLMILIVSIKRKMLPELFALFRELSTIWRRRTYIDDAEDEFLLQFEDAETRAREVDVMALIAAHIHRQNLPAVQAGAGNSSFPHKLHCLVHAVRLGNFTDGSVANFIEEVCSRMEDYGAEHMMRKLLPTPMKKVVPLLRANTYA